MQPSCYKGFACGGAVFVSGGGNLTVEHALFGGSSAGKGADGGAIKVITGGLAGRGVTFVGNQAYFGGAVNTQGCGSVEITRCLFDANVAQVGGGALRVNLGGPGAPSDSRLAISESEFTRNTAKAPNNGG